MSALHATKETMLHQKDTVITAVSAVKSAVMDQDSVQHAGTTVS